MEKHFYKILTGFDFTQAAALCSLVDFKGSVPRKDFPRMLVWRDGHTAGTVGGGPLEHTVINATQTVLQTGRPQLLHFEMTGDDPDSATGLCGGTAVVLVEVFTPVLQDQYRHLNWLKPAAKTHVVLTNFNPEHNTVQRIWDWDMAGNGRIKAMLGHYREGEIKGHASPGRWFRQVLTPPPILHIFGAGHVGRSVAELAHFLDLDVIIYDDRPEMVSPERFPRALQRQVDVFDRLIAKFTPASADYVLIMTKGHRNDYKILQRLLKLKVAYLGLMASQHKWQVLRKALQEDGFTEPRLNFVHAPIGLNIGSETVPEIALSILAEVVNHLRLGTRSPIALANHIA